MWLGSHHDEPSSSHNKKADIACIRLGGHLLRDNSVWLERAHANGISRFNTSDPNQSEFCRPKLGTDFHDDY
jgi:hypothetical protein